MAKTTDVGALDANERAVRLNALHDSPDNLSLSEVRVLDRSLLDRGVLAKTELDEVLDLIDATQERCKSNIIGGEEGAHEVILPSTS